MAGSDSRFDYDAIVAGGGPAGSTAAHLLARAGKSVLVLEKATFPRFVIGESLLPFSTPIFEKLGVLDEIKSRFQHKFGAFFTEEGKEANRKVVFAHGFKRGYGLAFHAKRAELDEILLRAAERAGAEVRFGWKVVAFSKNDGDGVEGVRAIGPDGASREIRARVVVDATGRAATGARAEGFVQPDVALRRGALFTHVTNAPRGEGETDGDIRMVVFEKGWWWFIPFSDGTWSVGVVTDAMPPGATLEERFDRLVESTATVRERLKDARRLMPVQAESDFSYDVRQIVGDGYVAIGDAAGFLDPIFSSGVFLAMATGEKAAEVLTKVLSRGGPVRAPDLRLYEKFARKGFRRFRKFVIGFYEPGFRDTFYQKPPLRALYSSVTSILAGGVFETSGALRLWSNVFLFFAGREIRKQRRAEVKA